MRRASSYSDASGAIRLPPKSCASAACAATVVAASIACSSRIGRCDCCTVAAAATRALLREMGLERRACLGARAVEQHALVRLAQVERVADLLGRPALHVPEDDDPPLHLGQALDRAPEHVERLAREERVFRE